MQSSVDEVLQKSWEASDKYRTETIETGLQQLQKKVHDALVGMEKEEEETFYHDLPGIETEIAGLLQRAKQFREGVEMWRWKAQVTIEMLEEKQRTLAYMVEDAAKNFEYRVNALQQMQEERQNAIRQRCEDVLKDSFQSFRPTLSEKQEEVKVEGEGKKISNEWTERGW